jgi:hypothetical protein
VVQFHSTLAATNSLTASLATNAQLTNAVASLATQNSVNAVANAVAALPTASATANAVCLHTSTNATTNTLLWAITQTKTKVDGLFNRGVINTTGPSTITAADIQIIRGDTYTTNSEPITFSLAGQPDLTNSTVKLTIRDKDTDEVVLTANGSVTTGGAGITQVVDCVTVAGNTDNLPVGSHPYDVQCVLPTGEVWTVATGLASIVKDQTRAA